MILSRANKLLRGMLETALVQIFFLRTAQGVHGSEGSSVLLYKVVFNTLLAAKGTFKHINQYLTSST